MFPFLTIFIAFLLFYAYKRNQITKQENEKASAFWELENKANSTRKKDIEHLNYIQIPLDSFPIGKYSSAAYRELEDALLSLCDKKILNLTGISNTDLKLQYGAANLELLGSYDDHFTELVRLLIDYAKLLVDDSHIDDAVTVLEFGVKIQSDITENYVLLATLYKDKGEAHRIRSLIEAAQLLNSLSKDSICKKLNELL